MVFITQNMGKSTWLFWEENCSNFSMTGQDLHVRAGREWREIWTSNKGCRISRAWKKSKLIPDSCPLSNAYLLSQVYLIVLVSISL